MVQRKVTNKLGIQADQAKTNNLLVNLRSSTLQHQDVKNKGADLKKKMKKSRPAKHSDLERSGSPNMRRKVPQPGQPPPPKPPAPVFSTTSASPQKKSPAKASDTTPNYMKATTSSDARKERCLQVSSKNLQTLFDSKSSSKKDSNSLKISSGSSVHKAARALARTSSLKLARSLTKTTSFKPARASAKKCSPLVLSENLDVQRATCSSTLKESKFPAYLPLSSGATEAEGTSAMKVCPYTYCSLNGHHHPPLPPLKSFLSARRRMLKNQRSFKLGCLSPRRSKPVSSSMEEIQVEQNLDEQSSAQDSEDSLMISPVIEEEQTEFFIQIYSKGKETTDVVADSSLNHIRPAVDGSPGGDETATQADSRQVLATLSDESPFSEIDSHGDSGEIIHAASSDSEAADYSEAGSYSTMDLDYAPESSMESIEESDLEGYSDEFESCSISEESIFKSDVTNRFFEEIHEGIFLKQSSDEEPFDNGSISSKGSSSPDYLIEECIEGLDDGSHGELDLQFADESIKPIKPEDLICDLKDEIMQDADEAEQIQVLGSQDFPDIIEESYEDRMEENEQGDQFKASIMIEICISLHSSGEATEDKPAKDCQDSKLELIQTGGESDQTLAIMDLAEGTPDQSAHDNSISSACETSNCLEENGSGNFKATLSADSGGKEADPIAKNTCGSTQNICQGSPSGEESAETCKGKNWKTGCKRSIEEYQDPKEFNPRAPNFLPLEPDPEAEKVDLKHQTMDERKNADEWMLDHAIQKAVDKLGPARKKKVALLVEAFETVLPVQRYHTKRSHNTFPFGHARPIQACS